MAMAVVILGAVAAAAAKATAAAAVEVAAVPQHVALWRPKFPRAQSSSSWLGSASASGV